MGKDRVIGAGTQLLGTAKETIGKPVGDARLVAEGKVAQVEAKLQNAAGGVKDTLRDNDPTCNHHPAAPGHPADLATRRHRGYCPSGGLGLGIGPIVVVVLLTGRL